MARWWIGLILLSAWASAAEGQRPPPGAPVPPYRLPRYLESWDTKQTDQVASPWRDIKNIALFDGDTRLSLGGEVRQVFEGFDNPAFGGAPVDSDESLLQRYMLHADLRVGEHARLFSDLKFNFEDGRWGGPRAADEDKADIHQGFVDLSADVDGTSVTVRAGRQELWLGSQRLVAIRNGPNVRQSFDGGRVTVRDEIGTLDLLYVRPVETDSGAFDDSTDSDRSLWGAYTTFVPGFVPGSLDAYYLGFSNDQPRFDIGTGSELRHTVGLRSFGVSKGFDWNWELFAQGGRVGDADIQAWSIGTDTGYTFAHGKQPRLGFRANIISGDHDRDDGTIRTFNALFPRGGYFGEIGILGPSNLMNLHPSVDWPLSDTVVLSADCVFFWRYSDDDGIYNAGGGLVRSGADSDALYIGTQPSLILTYTPTKQLFLVATYTHFYPGKFIEETGPDSVIRYARVEAGVRF